MMTTQPTERCRTCDQPLPHGRATPTYPFCSPRCKMIDLGRWMSGDYLISEPLIQDENETLAESETEPE